MDYSQRTIVLQNIGIIVSSIIACISLTIAIINNIRNKPKLKIVISDKNTDCFFGIKLAEENSKTHICVAGVYVNILNNSPVSIGINNAYLVINKEKYPFVHNENASWAETQFIYQNTKGNYDCMDSYIPYDINGLSIPTTVGAYDIVSKYLFFHDFPNSIHNSCCAKLVLETAIGKISKRIKLIEIDENYYNLTDWKDVCRFEKSIVKGIDEYNWINE